MRATLVIFVDLRTKSVHSKHRITGAPGLGPTVVLAGDVYKVEATTDIWTPSKDKTLLEDAAQAIKPSVTDLPEDLDASSAFEDLPWLERVFIAFVR